MSIGGASGDRLSKNQRREAAREKAKALREQQKKKERRSRYILQGSLIIVALAIVAVVTLIIVNSIRPPAPGPRNMLSDGITIGQGLEAETTPALAAGEDPVRSAPDPESGVISIQVWLDYQCPFCADFESTNSEQIETLLDQGAATLEIFPVAILDRGSLGARYSSRAANAAACVANYSPNRFYDFNAALFDNQPEEQSSGLTDDEIIQIAEDADVARGGSVADCIRGEDFKSWVADATERATSDPDLLTEDGQFATPAVFVGGQRYTDAPDDATAFARFVASADAAAFSEKSSASPSPSPSPSP